MSDGSRERELAHELSEAVLGPSQAEIEGSRSTVDAWFEGAAPKVSWATLDTKMGSLTLFKRHNRLVMIAFGLPTGTLLQSEFSLDRLVHSRSDLGRELKQLGGYFDGKRTMFDLSVSLEATTEFQRLVLTTTAKIPFGETLSYGQLAREIGRPNSSRAVGQALAANPIPVVIPCHRVVSSSGGLGGYAGGLNWKRRLLAHEGALAL